MPQDPSPVYTPVVPEERIVVLDVLRGFALLGIIIMNMDGFNMPWTAWAMDPRPFQGPLDRAASLLMMALFAGKANAIFSFLFGVGLTIQLQRAASRGGSFVAMYLRRLAVLLLLGAAHSVLLWDGDVLHVYAVLGLLLLPLRNASDRTVFILIGVFLITPLIRAAYAYFTQEPPIHPLPYYKAIAHEDINTFQSGTYAQQIASRLRDIHEGYIEALPRLQGWMWLYVSFAVTILLGLYAGRNRLFENVAAHAGTLRKVMKWCFGLGLTFGLGFAVMHVFRPPPTGLPTLLDFIAGTLFNLHRPLLCVAYIAAIALLFQRERVRRLLLPLASAGAMPLTNYLMQTILATTLFYSHGLALFATVGPALGLLLSIAIFAVQVVYSRWWLARFRFGPLEWLWRGAAYGKLSPLRRGLTVTLDTKSAA